ncbi:MAG TPA: hypothetical protein VH988_19045 [Thermoanaerobaculia bacterium]|nr:hypothetical protein [Thermoanaerobaculia bacterium]
MAKPRPERDPHSRLPLLYFSLAHVCLAAAFAALALQPQRFSAFFYHPRMVAVVHLVTLGWISASILGALYMVAPMALRTRLPARAADYAAWVVYVIGVTGMVAHFWIDSPKGMVWSAGTIVAALLWVTGRAVLALRPAPIPPEIKLHYLFAFLNLVGAASMGLLLGLNKVKPVLGGYVLANVYAHAHLAALGWATMMVMGTGYRLLPMLLPSAMPEGKGVWATALLLEAGAAGLFVSFVLRSGAVALFAVVTAAALVLFFRQVLWMRRHPRPAPRALRRPDYGVLHSFAALGSLALALLLGLCLAITRRASGSCARRSSMGCSAWWASWPRWWSASACAFSLSTPGCGPPNGPASRPSRRPRTPFRRGLSRPRVSRCGPSECPCWRPGLRSIVRCSSPPAPRRSSPPSCSELSATSCWSAGRVSRPPRDAFRATPPTGARGQSLVYR